MRSFLLLRATRNSRRISLGPHQMEKNVINETLIEHEKLGVLLHNIYLVKIHKSVCHCDGVRSARNNTKLLVKNIRTEFGR